MADSPSLPYRIIVGLMHLNLKRLTMKTANYFRIQYILIYFASLLMAGSAFALPEATRWVVENEHIKLEMIARTPEQMAAFYEARGFPKTAIQELNQMCFITTGVTNKSREVIWMKLANWTFTNKQGSLKRFHRNELKARLQKTDLAQQYLSTFRWTLIPETLDYRPEEREGGNIVLPGTSEPFNLHAAFVMGDEKTGKRISIELNDLRCAKD